MQRAKIKKLEENLELTTKDLKNLRDNHELELKKHDMSKSTLDKMTT